MRLLKRVCDRSVYEHKNALDIWSVKKTVKHYVWHDLTEEKILCMCVSVNKYIVFAKAH